MKSFGVKVVGIQPGGHKTNLTDHKGVSNAAQKAWDRLPEHMQHQYGEKYLNDREFSYTTFYVLNFVRKHRYIYRLYIAPCRIMSFKTFEDILLIFKTLLQMLGLKGCMYEKYRQNSLIKDSIDNICGYCEC